MLGTINFLDWFVNQSFGSQFLAIIMMEIMYMVTLSFSKSSSHSVYMILGFTTAVWLSTLYSPIWYWLFFVLALGYVWFQATSTINKE